jgi:tetratricopeptide (TPR) repeat protein
MIVLDDLHSADQGSLSLLEFVASAVLDAPVLIVGTYRDTEEALTQSLRDAHSGLARTTDYLPLVLTGLSAEDTAHFVELSAGVAPMPSLTAAIHEASEGNPLFVSELVRLLRTEDRLRELREGDALVLPRGVEQVIARRIEHLGNDCRRTLALAAIVGREFQIEVLERAGDVHGDQLLHQLDAARAVRVIEERPVLRFTHDLVRQTLYGALGQSDRRRMHAAVGEAMEHLPDATMAEVAHHFAEALPAGDAAKAVKYLMLAGEDAAEIAAPDEAAAYYERAAEIGQASGLDAATLCELYVRVAEQHVTSFDIARSPAAIERAEAFLAEAPDPARENRLAVARAYGRMLDAFVLEDEEIFAAIEFFEQRQDHAGAARAWLALEYVNCGRSRRLESGQAAERMLECARLAGSKQLIGNAIRYIAGTAALGAGTTSDGIRRLRALSTEAPDAITEARLLIAIGFLEGCRRRFDEARVLFAQAVELGMQARERAEIASYVWTRSAHLETLAGNYARAEESARRAVADLERQGLVRYLSSELMLLADALIFQGKLEEAEFHIDRSAPMAAPDDADALLRQARSRGRLEFARGEFAAAERHVRVALTHMEEAQAPDEHAHTLLDLAFILQAQGRGDEMRDAAADALRIAEERENFVFADRARALLGAQPAVALAD